MSNYDAIYSYWRGRTDAGAAASPTSSRQHSSHQPSSDHDLDASVAKVALERYYEPQILDLKQRLVACRGVRDALRNALLEVAPDHPFVSPIYDNELLGEIADREAETVTHWDDKTVP